MSRPCLISNCSITFSTASHTAVVLILRKISMTTMLSLFMMPLLIQFCASAASEIEPQVSQTSKVHLISLCHVYVARSNHSLRNYGLRWPNTVFLHAHALADAIQRVHKDCKENKQTNKQTCRQLLVSSVTLFKINRNQNQNRSVDYVQNLRKERRYLYKDPRQDSGHRNFPYARYAEKLFAKIEICMETLC